MIELDGDDEVMYLSGSRQGKGLHQSWKKFWTHHTEDTWPVWCQIDDCYNQATFGGHLLVRGYPGEFILPRCRDCYEESEWLSPKSTAIVVWAKVRIKY